MKFTTGSVHRACSIAASPHTDPATLTRLARDPRKSVRLAVAGNTNTPAAPAADLFGRACTEEDRELAVTVLACHDPLVVLERLRGWVLFDFGKPELQKIVYGSSGLIVEALITNLDRQDKAALAAICALRLPWAHAVAIVAAARGLLTLSVTEILTLAWRYGTDLFVTAELHRLAIAETVTAGRELTVELIEAYESAYAAAVSCGLSRGFAPVAGLVSCDETVVERLRVSPTEMLRATLALAIVNGGVTLTDRLAGGLVELSSGFPETADILLGSLAVRSAVSVDDLLALIEFAGSFPPAEDIVAPVVPDDVLSVLDWDGLRRVLRCSHTALTQQWLRGELAIEATPQRLRSLAADPGRAFGDWPRHSAFRRPGGSISGLLYGDTEQVPLVYNLVAGDTLNVAARCGPLSPAARFVGTTMAQRFGDDPLLWRTALSMGASFDATFTDLCDTVQAVHEQPPG